MTILPEIRQVFVTRYIAPLREGGSLPALAEADDGFKYVLKFRGAGQGVKALIAELIGGEMAKLLGIKIPELVFADLDEAFGRTEPDEEIQDLLKASRGLNLGLHFLSGALTFDSNLLHVSSEDASKIVWLDAFLTNVDRTARNTNMLIWKKELWLIDMGASLYFHHSWENWEEQSTKPFVQIKDHVLLKYAKDIQQTNQDFRNIITPDILKDIVERIPDDWLHWDDTNEPPHFLRKVYFDFLTNRLNNSDIFVNEALHAREKLI
ncbi:MAG: aminotransferase class I and II [Pseudopedobacter saltans]|uniref:Aminotransferase class I and II n=1 Tax=Pseudopedobacter saltans TaxID=151895 RepID=A0A2W5F8K6_9SPHI|nr:MAG: aminotransferase class I and II [Pseudopedobacter saltans]